MAKTKVCKSCKMFVEGEVCQNCKKNEFTTNWQGRIFFIDTKKSKIAQQIGVETKGEFAIKAR